MSLPPATSTLAAAYYAENGSASQRPRPPSSATKSSSHMNTSPIRVRKRFTARASASSSSSSSGKTSQQRPHTAAASFQGNQSNLTPRHTFSTTFTADSMHTKSASRASLKHQTVPSHILHSSKKTATPRHALTTSSIPTSSSAAARDAHHKELTLSNSQKQGKKIKVISAAQIRRRHKERKFAKQDRMVDAYSSGLGGRLFSHQEIQELQNTAKGKPARPEVYITPVTVIDEEDAIGGETRQKLVGKAVCRRKVERREQGEKTEVISRHIVRDRIKNGLFATNMQEKDRKQRKLLQKLLISTEMDKLQKVRKMRMELRGTSQEYVTFAVPLTIPTIREHMNKKQSTKRRVIAAFAATMNRSRQSKALNLVKLNRRARNQKLVQLLGKVFAEWRSTQRERELQAKIEKAKRDARNAELLRKKENAMALAKSLKARELRKAQLEEEKARQAAIEREQKLIEIQNIKKQAEEAKQRQVIKAMRIDRMRAWQNREKYMEKKRLGEVLKKQAIELRKSKAQRWRDKLERERKEREKKEKEESERREAAKTLRARFMEKMRKMKDEENAMKAKQAEEDAERARKEEARRQRMLERKALEKVEMALRHDKRVAERAMAKPFGSSAMQHAFSPRRVTHSGYDFHQKKKEEKKLSQKEVDRLLLMIQEKDLHRAVRQRDWKAVLGILAMFATAMERQQFISECLNHVGQNPLHVAAKRGLRKITECLLSNHCNVDSQDSKGNTALHYGAETNSEDIVRLLILYGADENIPNKQGKTPTQSKVVSLLTTNHLMTYVHERKMGTLLNPLKMDRSVIVPRIMERQGMSRGRALWLFVQTYVCSEGGIHGALRRQKEKLDEALVSVPVRLLSEFEPWYEKTIKNGNVGERARAKSAGGGIGQGFKVRATGSMMMKEQLQTFAKNNPQMAAKFAAIDEEGESSDSHAGEDSDVVATDSDGDE